MSAVAVAYTPTTTPANSGRDARGWVAAACMMVALPPDAAGEPRDTRRGAVYKSQLYPGARRPLTASMTLRVDGSTPSAVRAPPSITALPSTSTLNSA